MNIIAAELMKDVPREYSTFYNALRELMQDITLSGLSRTDFFKRAAFQGGTCLRLLHGLDRYSEDLVFCVTDGKRELDLDSYATTIDREFGSFGINAKVEIKKNRTNIAGCMVKGNLWELMTVCGLPESKIPAMHHDALIRIKLDIDTETPPGFRVEHAYRLKPIHYPVASLDLPSLFAGKMSAVIGRQWHNRFKGRDLYDFEWYVQKGIPPNMSFLESNLKRACIIDENDTLTECMVKDILAKRFSEIDYESAYLDIRSFVSDGSSISSWDEQYFNGLISRMVFE